MKKTIFLFCFVSVFLVSAFSQTVTLKKMPKTVDEFVKLRNKIATTPQGGASMFVLALKIYEKNHTFGRQCLVIATDRSRLQKGNVYKGFQLFSTDYNRIKRQIESNPYIVDYYFKGASPENGYKTKLPYVLNFSTNAYCGDPKTGKYKIFVKCYAADSPRPIKIVKNNKGYWKASEWSSIIMGGKKPIIEVDDDL